MAFLVETLVLVAVVVYLLYLLASRNDNYWRKRGVPGPRPVPFFGSQMDPILARTSFIDFYRRVYDEFPDAPFVGLLTAGSPSLYVRDPELIKHILTKDFEYFPDHGVPHNETLDPLSGNLFNLDGVRWKNLRIKLTPTFTSGKIKRMFPLMLECSRELRAVLREPAARAEVVEFKELLGRFSTDIIGTCAFGVTCNSLKDPDAEFRRQGMKTVEVSPRILLRNALMMALPKATFLHALLKSASYEEFLIKVIRENIQHREAQSVKRNDFLDLLIELKNKGSIVDNDVDVIQDPFLKVPVSTSSEELKFTDNLLAAQSSVFFTAGFETSSSAMSFCLLELAYNPEIQQRVQNEIDSVLKNHEDITYEALSEMKYLDQAVSETLRKYPALPVLIRRAIKPYPLPDSKVVVEAGMRVSIAVYGMHHDPALYPDPERFDPERFSPESKAKRHPYTYLPFGEGPRICIGMRFGLLQTKLGLASVLSRYSVEPSALSQYPVEFKKGAFLTTAKGGHHLIVRERTSAPPESA